MDIDEFQAWVRNMPMPQSPHVSRLGLLAIGLGGESGEVIELLKKHLRDDTPLDLPHLKLELGDVLIIISEIASHAGFGMSEVMAGAVAKTESRMRRGMMRGSGNDR